MSSGVEMEARNYHYEQGEEWFKEKLIEWLENKYDDNWFVLQNNKSLETNRVCRNMLKDILEFINGDE